MITYFLTFTLKQCIINVILELSKNIHAVNNSTENKISSVVHGNTNRITVKAIVMTSILVWTNLVTAQDHRVHCQLAAVAIIPQTSSMD